MPYRALAYAALLVLGLALASAQATGEYPLQACSANYLPRGSQCQVSASSSASNNGGANSGICQLGLVCSLWSASSGDSNGVNRNSRESNGNNNNGNGGTPKDPFCLLRTAACLAGTGSGSNTGGGSSNNGSNQNGTCAVRPVVGDACTDQLPCFDAVYNVTCRNGMCVYHNFLVAGEACNPDPLYFNGGCAGSLTCTNGVCGPATADGAQCSTGASNCGAGSYCNGARNAQSGVCTAFLATGGACTGSYQCAPGNICVRQASGNGNQGVCTALANIATPAIIGQQLESLATTAALAKPSSFLQNCSNSFDCQLGFRCVCNGTQNICLRVNHTAVAQTTLDWLACIQAAGCPDPLRLEPGASITFGPGSCWEARCCQQTAAYFGITNPKCPAAATEAPAPAPATAAPVTAAPTAEPITASTSAAAGSVTSGTTSGTTSGATTGASSATTGATSAATSAATGAGSVVTTGVATTGSITTGVSPASRRRM